MMRKRPMTQNRNKAGVHSFARDRHRQSQWWAESRGAGTGTGRHSRFGERMACKHNVGVALSCWMSAVILVLVLLGRTTRSG